MAKEINTKVFNWLEYQKVYFAVSLLLIATGAFSLANWGLVFGLDFTGGAAIEYQLDNGVTKEELLLSLSQNEIVPRVVQEAQDSRIIIKTDALSADAVAATETVAEELGVERVQVQNIGPTVGPEMVTKTIYGVLLAAGVILLWVIIQFKRPTFGIAAILASVHDGVVQIGAFSLLGKLYGAEVDFLFVTAVLTTLALSMHDTIVVFDRVREVDKKYGGSTTDICNRAISETMRRSVMTSLTLIVVLVSLVVFGGDTIRWFAVALLIGTVSGTYSSPFVAVPLYVALEKLRKRAKRK